MTNTTHRFLAALVAGAAMLMVSATAQAQLSEVELDRGPASDLYIKRRPPTPEPPRIPKELEGLLIKAEKRRDNKRKEAIGLLRGFLNSNPSGAARAEGLFKLAELLWEEARTSYIEKMIKYDRRLEKCKLERCKRQPKLPELAFGESETLYKAILKDHGNFRRTDLVLYLVGFAAREDARHQESLGYFKQVIDRFPQSPMFGDAWMMIGEFYFASFKWRQARDAYSQVLERPDAPTYDLALFKTAWSNWKLGNIDLAAEQFKLLLDLAVEAERSGSLKLRKRRAQLRDETLEYLVIIFTEDQSLSAKEIYEFLAGIGGERYSKDVLNRVADAYHIQAEYDRSVDTYKFLIDLNPRSPVNAAHQRRIIEARLLGLEDDKALKEIKILLGSYGPKSDWAKENRGSKLVAKSMALNEKLIRTTATNFHADAQQEEKRGTTNLAVYKRAAAIYELYLGRYGKHKNASEVRFLRAEILFFKLEKWEEAGNEYLKVGRSAPVGKYHKDALLKAMEAFEKARPSNVTGKRELLPVDRKFAAAVDLYATLFPADPALVEVVFRNGQLFYDYGDYDEAIKRFGLIVTKYPNDPNAGPAGDRILGALKKAENYENIEEWARKLKKAKAFRSPKQQKRLNRLIVESIGKSGEKYGKAGKYTRAANFYLRIPKEFPRHALAPSSMFNAAIMLEKAKRPEAAAATYLALGEKYPKHKLSAKAAFTAAQVYEKMAYFDRAAEAYEVVVKKHSRTKYGADALFNAGLLRQALGQYRRAIRHFQVYAKQFRKRKDAVEVAFRIGVVYEDAGDDGRADRAYRDYARRYRKTGQHAVETRTRAGRTALKLGHTKRAAGQLKEALRKYKKLKGKDKQAAQRWAAEARYHEGQLLYRKYKRVSLNVKPRKLSSALKQKTKMLEKAQSVFLDVVDIGDLQWATAGLFRIGQIYEEFAKALRDAPTPTGLSQQDQDLYRDGLETHIVLIEERAIALYITGYQKALELRVYNTYTKQLRHALGRMSSTDYPPQNETRSRVRMGDRPPKPAFVKEVVRDE